MRAGQIQAPWTAEQAAALNRFQRNEHFHPFTCANQSEHSGVVLVATEEGWFCPVRGCDYTQNWAWEGMLLDWPNLLA